MPTQKSKVEGAHAILVMGVAGSGKSTVGAELGRALGWRFFDGDKFHLQVNVQKMAQACH
ncbi:MAG TPA: shikimate kinase [Anaerolineales bacterium]|nr:shikimate kinase [Anaerolineales bacterium]